MSLELNALSAKYFLCHHKTVIYKYVTRFPNLVVGVLTRDSVRQALRGGITADQIISYLEQHAHPNVRIAYT